MEGRYYQQIAVNRVLEAIAEGRDRILLTLATGTGKTFIAFQIAWKLFHSRWNLSREPTRRPRILFLADRNILANQAFNNFAAFEMQKMIDAEESDLFDVLLYIRYALDPTTRIARASHARGHIHTDYSKAQEALIDFVLGQYITEGVDQLDIDQLSPLLRLRYGSMSDAIADLGDAGMIREMFRGFQRYLYEGGSTTQ